MKIPTIAITLLTIFTSLLTFATPSQATRVTIQSRLDDGHWRTDTAIYPLKDQTITLTVKPIPQTIIRWYQIIPDLSQIYKNANHPWEANPYQWVGFAKIQYAKVELQHFRDQWEIQPFQISDSAKNWWQNFRDRITGTSSYYQTNLGSFWFQVELEKSGQIVAQSAGIADSDAQGLSPKVFRLSIRDSQDYLGYLSTFFNVPGLFGSTTYQSNNYIGVDCADVLITAYSRWQKQPLTKNYNVGMLINQFPKIQEFDIEQGIPNQSLTWQKDLLPGDLIAVKYPNAKQYQHIGALAKDANQNGLLDDTDLVLHAGPLPLHYSPLKRGNFDGHVVILRLAK